MPHNLVSVTRSNQGPITLSKIGTQKYDYLHMRFWGLKVLPSSTNFIAESLWRRCIRWLISYQKHYYRMGAQIFTFLNLISDCLGRATARKNIFIDFNTACIIFPPWQRLPYSTHVYCKCVYGVESVDF